VKVQAMDEFVNELKKIQEEAEAALRKVWKGQLACSPTPPFPGILAEHLHLVPIPLSYLILHLLSFIPFLTM